MSLIVDTILAYLPSKRKQTPSGWISVNSPCCHHNGTSADNRQRGGIHIHDEGVSWHCFNCGYKTSWQPGRPLSIKFKKLLQWLSVPDSLINKCTFEALRLKEETAPATKHDLVPQFFNKELPVGARPIAEWINESPPDSIVPVLEYLLSRGFSVDQYPWYWTPTGSFSQRLIVPFYYQGRTVGYTARLCAETKTVKYISEQQPGYVFNLDNQLPNRQWVFVTEGPLDAVCLDSVAVMSNEASPQQRLLIDRLQRPVVVVPDRDSSGLKLIEQAIEWNWSVSFPEWEPGIKDVNAAVLRYGRLSTLWSVIQSIETAPLKIQLKARQWIR